MEPFESVESCDLGPFIDRCRGRDVILLGEATHGTSEFYRLRTRMTLALIRELGVRAVALEADWTDAPRIRAGEPADRFPHWMWRNEETRAFVRELPAGVPLFGLDLYNLYDSIAEVLKILERRDPESARVARERYACLDPWAGRPEAYGRLGDCEPEVTSMLQDLLRARLDGAAWFDAVQNARVVASAERYYRALYYGSVESWNLRDEHMFSTLDAILRHTGGPVVVWAHNSHVGDAEATEFFDRGEINLGHLARRARRTYHVGFGTDHGTVAAAHDWDGPAEVLAIAPSHPQSHERGMHDTGIPNFLLPLAGRASARRLERAIGVVYRRETERASHYFEADLARQFDEYAWLDETHAVTATPHEAPALHSR